MARYLARTGRLDVEAAPGARLTREALGGFIGELQGRVAPHTVLSCLRTLSGVIAAIDRTADRTLLRNVIRNLSREATPRRDKRARMVPPDHLYRAGIGRMQRVDGEIHEKIGVKAGLYRDGLILAFLAAQPIRLGTLAAMRLDQHMTREDGIYSCRFAFGETKSKQPHEFDLPPELTPFLDRYLAVHRPALLRGAVSDAVWISTYRGPMSEQSLYLRFRAATRAELGVELNPHLARDIAATGIANQRPDLVGITPMVLHHGDERPSQQWYTHARRIQASRIYGRDLLDRRRDALDAEDDG